MRATNDILQIPLNRARFQQYRNLNAFMTALGIGMILVVLARGWYLLGDHLTDLKDPAVLILVVLAGICVLLMIGLPIIPSWQLAWCHTRVLKQNLPALIVDRESIQDNASNYTLGRIPWSEIESIIITERYAGSIKKSFPGIAIVLKDQNSLLKKKSKIVAMCMQSDNEIVKKRQVFIPQARIGLPIVEVVKLINDAYGDWVTANVR